MSPRRVIAGIGRSLITAGVLLLLFVAYQLWGTGFAHAARQNKAEKAFAAALAEAGMDPNASLTVTPTSAPPETVPETLAPTTVAGTDDPIVVGDVTTTTRKPKPVVTTSTLPQVRAGRSKMQRPATGKVLGRLVIHRIKLDQFVVEGSDKESLKTGPGHYIRTPMPGQPGNAAIACHRTTYGAPCFNLDLLNKGDEILVQTLQGTFRYLVDRSWRVSPKDSTVLADTPGANVLTLTTCDPKYSAARRLIVRAILDGPALPSDLYEPVKESAPPITEIVPETEPVTAAPETTAPASAAPTSAAGAVAATDAPASVAETTADTLPADTLAPASTEAAAATPDAELQSSDPEGTGPVYSLFWFHGHRSTWLSMIGFAALCGMIWLGAWRLARGRRLLGQALIYVPIFLVAFGPALFFCFDNLARLLPDSV